MAAEFNAYKIDCAFRITTGDFPVITVASTAPISTTTTWNTQPGASRANLGTRTFSHGYSSSCPEGVVEVERPGGFHLNDGGGAPRSDAATTIGLVVPRPLF